MSLIALVQAAALIYGLYAGYTSRLVYGVFVDKAFMLVKATEIEPQELAKARLPEYRNFRCSGRSWWVIDMPTDPKTLSDMNFYSAFGLGYQNLPQYFVPLERSREEWARRPFHRARLHRKIHARSEIDALLKSRRLEWSGSPSCLSMSKPALYCRGGSGRMNVIKVLPEDPFGSKTATPRPSNTSRISSSFLPPGGCRRRNPPRAL